MDKGTVYTWKKFRHFVNGKQRHLAHCGIFENGVLPMYTLEGVNSVATFITAYEESQ